MTMAIVHTQQRVKRFTEPNPPASFKWVTEAGKLYSVRPEARGKGVYWYMRKTVNGRLFNLYVAPAGLLSAELLNNAAAHIEAQEG